MSSGGFAIRNIREDEFSTYIELIEATYGRATRPEQVARYRRLTELDRTVAAFDGDRMVATAEACSFSTSVPGGATMGTAGVTSVAVAAEYRRRGLLRALMDAVLAQAVERGEVLATLFSSEAGIYGRFGFGMAVPLATIRLDRAHASFRPTARPDGRVRTVDVDEARRHWPEVYEQVRRLRAGMNSRHTHSWWEATVLADDEQMRAEWGILKLAVHENADGAPDGYLIARVKGAWEEGLPAGVVDVIEHLAATPSAEVALWRFALDTDLTARLVAELRPVDDALPLLLADSRRARVQVADGLYVRLVDLPAALSSRSYTSDGDVVMDVTDHRFDANAGTWRLQVRDGAAELERGRGPAELRLDVSELGAAYLGGVRLTSFVAAGLVEELVAGAAARLDRLLASDRAPWAPQVF